MAYKKTVWKNREVERPRTFEKTENPDGTITLAPAEGNIIEPGTPLIAENMNNIEQGIEDAHNQLSEHTSANITAHNVSRGTSNFAGNNQEVTIPHGLSVVPTSAYAFPVANPEGYLGEVWIRMDATNLYVGNSGSFTGAMSWTAIG